MGFDRAKQASRIATPHRLASLPIVGASSAFTPEEEPNPTRDHRGRLVHHLHTERVTPLWQARK